MAQRTDIWLKRNHVQEEAHFGQLDKSSSNKVFFCRKALSCSKSTIIIVVYLKTHYDGILWFSIPIIGPCRRKIIQNWYFTILFVCFSLFNEFIRPRCYSSTIYGCTYIMVFSSFLSPWNTIYIRKNLDFPT